MHYSSMQSSITFKFPNVFFRHAHKCPYQDFQSVATLTRLLTIEGFPLSILDSLTGKQLKRHCLAVIHTFSTINDLRKLKDGLY